MWKFNEKDEDGVFGVVDDDVCIEVDTRFMGFGFGNNGRGNSE